MSDAKPFWQSRTIWFNVGMAALLAVAAAMKAYATGDGQIDAEDVQLPDQLVDYGKWVLVAGNLVLRLITKVGVKLRDQAGADGPRDGFRVFPPTAALLAVCLVGDCAVAQTVGKPELVVTVTEPKIPGQRLIVDASQTKADRVEIAIWAEGLPAGPDGLEQFAELIEELKRAGAEVIEPPAGDGAAFETRFSLDGQRTDIVVLDSTAGAHYVVLVAAFTDEGSERAVFERRVPGESPAPPNPPQPPVPPGPGPPPGPPNPPTPPTPPEPPEPEIEEGRFRVTRRVYESAQRVESPNRSDEAKRIVGVLRDVADDVKNGETRGSSAIRKAIIESLQTVLTDAESARWSIGFGAELARIIFDLLTSGKLGTWQDWVDLLLEIAKALELLT